MKDESPMYNNLREVIWVDFIDLHEQWSSDDYSGLFVLSQLS